MCTSSSRTTRARRVCDRRAALVSPVACLNCYGSLLWRWNTRLASFVMWYPPRRCWLAAIRAIVHGYQGMVYMMGMGMNNECL